MTRQTNTPSRMRLPVLALLLVLPLSLAFGCDAQMQGHARQPVQAWIDLMLDNYRAFEEVDLQFQDWRETMSAAEAAVRVSEDVTDEEKKQRDQEKEDERLAREYYHEALHTTPRYEFTDASNPDGRWQYQVTFWFYKLAPAPNVDKDARGKDRYRLVQQREVYTFTVADLDGWRLTGGPTPRGGRELAELCFPPDGLLPVRR